MTLVIVFAHLAHALNGLKQVELVIGLHWLVLVPLVLVLILGDQPLKEIRQIVVASSR